MKGIFIFALFFCGFPLPGIKTIDNLKNAYVDEANTSRQYELYAEKAEGEKQKEVAKLFRALSKSESIHKKNHAATLAKLNVPLPPVTYGKVKIYGTENNLKMLIQPERTGTVDYYPRFIAIAKEEKIQPAVASFTYAMESEQEHLVLLRNTLFNYYKLAVMDYYVSDSTGVTLAQPAGKPAPVPRLQKEHYIKIN